MFESELSSFDDIAPLRDKEVPEAVTMLLGEENFVKVLEYMFKNHPIDNVKALFRSVKTVRDFQWKISYPFMKMVERQSTSGVVPEKTDTLQKGKNYLFISNHRDITLDSAFLCIILMDVGRETPEIAIGDNLLIYPWIETLVRLNKSFIVRRGVSGRSQLEASRHLSAYIRYALQQKRQSIWLAQRQGRAKDSDDRTQESLLKMLNMSGNGSIIENMKELNICPLTISYQYDPCDFLKAKEFQQKRDNPDYQKSPTDDLLNMQTGILGFKGKIVYTFGQKLVNELDALQSLPRAELFASLAQLIDKQIHFNYAVFDTNRIAYDLLFPEKAAGGYAPEVAAQFETYLNQQIDKIDLPDKDIPFLRHKLLEMYSNPLINKQIAIQ